MARPLSPYLFAAIEQGIGSLLNLGVNLALARNLPPEEYGAFAFWSNAGFMLASLQNAISVSHLFTLAPGDGQAAHRAQIERLMHLVTGIWLVLALALSVVGVMAMARLDEPLAVWPAAVFIPAFLLQQYVRALAFSRGQAGVAALQTAGVALLAAASLIAVLGRSGQLHADAAIACLAFAYGVAGLIGGARAVHGQLGRLSRDQLSAYGPLLRQSGWIFVGVSATELLTRFYSFIVAGWFGAAALAGLSATQLLMRPIPLLSTSWGLVARGDLARRRDAGDWRGFRRMSLMAGVGGLVAAAIWTLVVYLSWELVSEHVFGGKYAELRWMTLVWGACAAIGFLQTVASSSLQALRAFKPLALSNAAAAAVAMLAILVLAGRYSEGGALFGTLAGQALELAAMTLILSRLIPRSPRSTPD
jgi:O-antigen/teichoic acid export membrane protein